MLKSGEIIDAILLDLVMPKMNGYEFLAAIKDTPYKDCPIIVLTGESDGQAEYKALEAGAWDFAPKPYDKRVLMSRLRNAIARSEVAALKKIDYLSKFCPLTGIYNKTEFFKVTSQMIHNEPDHKYVLIRLDINRFSMINSFYGMETGDQLLCYLAKQLKHCAGFHELTTYGHIEADVFAFCVTYDSWEDILEMLRIVVDDMAAYPLEFALEPTFGICFVEDLDTPIFQMLDDANTAAKSVKGNVLVNYAVFKKEMQQSRLEEQRISNMMYDALEHEEFCVYMQPKYDIHHHHVSGAEALVRWNRPGEGLISPGRFIPVFEKNGFIVKLDYYMWEHVCQLLQRWSLEGKHPNPVSVNISRISMFDPHIVDKITGLVETYQIPPRLLNLEITESAYMADPQLMKEVIMELHQKGFTILMDDFGSGYSSLNTLKEIDMDILKIDMNFLPKGERMNVKCEKILTSVTRMAGWLGMSVVVEGVETREQLDFLESIGCRYIQGYYFARPMPAKEYEEKYVNNPFIISPKENDVENIVLAVDDAVKSVWSSNQNIASIMNGMKVPYAICEYRNYTLEIIRVNNCFHQEFCHTNQEYVTEKEIFDYKELQKFYDACAEAVLNKRMASCDCCAIAKMGKAKYYRIRIQYIGNTGNSNILCVTFIDVTAQMELENVVHSVFNLVSKPESQAYQMLIVDDSEMSREILRPVFDSEYEILYASNGEEALLCAKEHAQTLSIILLDLLMPKMSGIEFLQVRKQNPELLDIPVIIISSEGSQELQIQMLKYGVNDYIVKPYVPELVKRRVQNVMEYKSRFQSLLKEYNENSTLKPIAEKKEKSVYTIDEMTTLLKYMSGIFDMVRLVQPEKTAVIKLEGEHGISILPYTCFKAWNKSCRCENCTSICAGKSERSMAKYECIDDKVFYVISHPIKLMDKNGGGMDCVIEIISQVEDTVISKGMSVNKGMNVQKLLDETIRKIYADDLTEAYNRRYWSEMRFLYCANNQISEKIAVVMLDLTHFKQINDTYGHQEGDRILKDVAKALKEQIRFQDSLIRYGGDEFLVVLTGINESVVATAINRFRKSLKTVHYGEDEQFSVSAAFGYAYTSQFKASQPLLSHMFSVADKNMYKEKHQ